MSESGAHPLSGVAGWMEDDLIDRVGSAAYKAMIAAGAMPEVAAEIVAEHEAEQRYETPPPPKGERLLGVEMVRRLQNPDYDRRLGRPEDADDLEDEMGRSLLL